MKKHNYYLNLFVLSFTCLFSFNQIEAQQSNAVVTYDVEEDGIPLKYTLNDLGLSNDKYNSAQGSPYLEEDFNIGKIKTDNFTAETFMRYNVFLDEIEISKDKKYATTKALPKKTDIKIVLNNKTFIYLNTNPNEKRIGKYFQLVSEGENYDLIMRNNKRFIPETIAVTSYGQDTPGRFETTQVFYLLSKNKKFTRLPDSRRQLLKMFPDDKKKVKIFLRENRINLNDVEDMKIFAKFYDANF